MVHVRAPGMGLEPEGDLGLADIHCSIALDVDGPAGISRSAEGRWSRHPCCKAQRLEACLGAPIAIERQRFGTVGLSSAAIKELRFAAPYEAHSAPGHAREEAESANRGALWPAAHACPSFCTEWKR